MKLEIKKEEYGPDHAGSYDIRALTTREADEALRKVVSNSKDKIGYVNALMTASITGPHGPMTLKTIPELPYQLYRRLMDKVLESNETGEEEANFSQNSPTVDPQSPLKDSKETPGA